ncbi:hypothetical protein KZ483_25780 [Paenibacillus sp. sptzw28]|uniref:hypothetical protein n=1 Tax=Paenibacillus sp. sptzw28 TaxID=715179 RepID=UPI001C6E11B6|nr:hypothetical protein [Paenibacillus sp. sptzw28]QYR21088.1 hypothetical protein KZ483_25780 [Paenibacillus sp. sptzw28]
MNEMMLHTSSPPIYAFPIYANLLSIISNHRSSDAWYYSNFIQLNASPVNHTLSFYDCWNYIDKCPLISKDLIDRSVITTTWNNDIIRFLIHVITEGSYAYFFIDEAKIKNSYLSKSQKSFTHDVMVYGYNLKERIFHIAGSFGSGKYTESTCSFEEMKQAYDNTDLSKDWFYGIQLLRCDSEGEFEFDPNIFKEQLSDYLLSVNCAKKSMDHQYLNERFGMDVYDVVVDYLSLLAEGKSTKRLVKPLHFLWEHKKCMYDRIVYMDKRNYFLSAPNIGLLKEVFSDISTRTLLIRNRFLKYFVDNNEKSIGKIIRDLQKVRTDEEYGIKLLLEST